MKLPRPNFERRAAVMATGARLDRVGFGAPSMRIASDVFVTENIAFSIAI